MSRAADLPPALWHWRCAACWVALGVLALVVASFWSLDLQWAAFLGADARASMVRFAGEFFPPDLTPAFVARVARATWETLAMSAVGTLVAALAALVLAVPAAQHTLWRLPALALLNALRAVPELVWAALLLIAAGLGPLAGTLALALHTTGVLGRLFAQAVEAAPSGPADALRLQGVSAWRVWAWATLPQVAPALVSYTLYRWENNIRAATVLGVVGAGGLGQMLAFHLGLFHMGKTATVLAAMMVLVWAVDAASYGLRRALA